MKDTCEYCGGKYDQYEPCYNCGPMLVKIKKAFLLACDYIYELEDKDAHIKGKEDVYEYFIQRSREG